MFTNDKLKFRYLWKTRKVRSLFVLKDPVIHKANVIYKGTWSCREFYVGETKRNCEVRWWEHCSTKEEFEVGDHLLLNPGHTLSLKISKKLWFFIFPSFVKLFLLNTERKINSWYNSYIQVNYFRELYYFKNSKCY